MGRREMIVLLTLFSISQGLVMAARSQTVMVMARRSSLWSSHAQLYVLDLVRFRNIPRFLQNNNNSSSGTHSNDGKHHLRNIEGVPPVVVGDIAVVFLHTEKPSAENFVIYVKPFDEV
uniref:Uncharacterized protein n=1 Tax=Timema bartmani TaxID=61472 RepID=A0A7R9F8M3_9NEOP|nr:unnamed protein product [Timema bartmani]